MDEGERPIIKALMAVTEACKLLDSEFRFVYIFNIMYKYIYYIFYKGISEVRSHKKVESESTVNTSQSGFTIGKEREQRTENS